MLIIQGFYFIWELTPSKTNIFYSSTNYQDSTQSTCPSLMRRIFTTSLWEFECRWGMKVGLSIGRYSGYNRPSLKRTPHALQSVLAPVGPALHCGVFFVWQCMHILPPVVLLLLHGQDGGRLAAFLRDLVFLLSLSIFFGANPGPTLTSSLSGVVGPGCSSLMCIGSKMELLAATKESGSSLIWIVGLFWHCNDKGANLRYQG